ncbi:hypothetical protein [Mastigocoleus testarum]|uniref:Uncharacterized protein n=1 Tax=Mastigocoleus testarum BC008 TaxID=371196 RepID=A0A0V7ZJS1_9CYAN|nr:hypothetical protein [Mastigocoleus testarum]KST62202.1 hypothetical protein BC008_37800 [Mastigocoleus testarum BC008]KST64832.1 hypothetical protein BC008_18630 [Mastigocoleus testarum BC008]
MLQTEFPFTLPRGYVDGEGNLHREGVMRLATAYDEIAPMKDPRCNSNPAYLVVIIFSRVITRLGTLDQVNPKVIEGLFATDLAFLQDFYRRINEDGTPHIKTVCPKCGQEHEIEVIASGEV